MYSKTLKALALVVTMLTASMAFAVDTAWDEIDEIKVFDTHVDIVLESEVHSTCLGGGATSRTFRLEPDETNMIRFAEAMWLAGKEVNLRYTCGTLGGGLTGIITGVRAR